MAHGKGFFKYANGAVFYGYWVSNKVNGDGIYLDVNGTKWVGPWHDDYLNGIGLEMKYKMVLLT